MYKIAITGPESTGKTTLANHLARELNVPLRSEYAREYLSQIGLKYEQIDVENIAKNQIAQDHTFETERSSYVADTELMVIFLWMKIRYRFVPEYIIKAYEEQHFDLYLLCDIDIPWERDSLREHAHARVEIFNLMKNELQRLDRRFVLISGQGEARQRNGLEAVKLCLGLST